MRADLGGATDEEKTPLLTRQRKGRTASPTGLPAPCGKSDDQMPRFLAEGIWENGYEDQFSDLFAA